MKYVKLDASKISLAFQELDKMDLTRISLAEIVGILGSRFAGYQIQVPKFEPGILLYRGRVCSKPLNYSEIIYPKSEFVKGYGRANDIGQSVFYGGVGRITPIKEIGAKPGDTMVLSHWINTKELILNHVGFSNQAETLLQTGRSLETVYDFIAQTKNFNEVNTQVYNYLASKFVSPIPHDQNHLYKLSAAISYWLMKGADIDGILYPSVAYLGNSDNIILKPQVVDTKLKLISIEFIKVKSFDGTKYEVEFLDTATTIEKSGAINWSGRLLAWEGKDNFTAKVENNELIKRDAAGNLIFPSSTGDLIGKNSLLLENYKKEIDYGFKATKSFRMAEAEKAEFFVSSVLNFKENIKFLNYYIPDISENDKLAATLVYNYNDFLNIEDGNVLQLKNTEGMIIFSSDKVNLIPKIQIFSERKLNEVYIRESYPVYDFVFYYPDNLE